MCIFYCDQQAKSFNLIYNYASQLEYLRMDFYQIWTKDFCSIQLPKLTHLRLHGIIATSFVSNIVNIKNIQNKLSSTK